MLYKVNYTLPTINLYYTLYSVHCTAIEGLPPGPAIRSYLLGVPCACTCTVQYTQRTAQCSKSSVLYNTVYKTVYSTVYNTAYSRVYTVQAAITQRPDRATLGLIGQSRNPEIHKYRYTNIQKYRNRQSCFSASHSCLLSRIHGHSVTQTK